MNELKKDIEQLNDRAYSPDFWKIKSGDYFVAVKLFSYFSRQPIPEELGLSPAHATDAGYLYSPGLIWIEQYLMGVSIELLLKALCIKKGKNYLEFKKHDLMELVTYSKILIDEDEIKMIKFFTECIYNYNSGDTRRNPNYALSKSGYVVCPPNFKYQLLTRERN